MKKMNLAIGTAFTWFGVEKYSNNSIFSGWVLLVVGIITILSAFFSFTGSGSSWSGGDGGGGSWGDSSGGDGGGGGD